MQRQTIAWFKWLPLAVIVLGAAGGFAFIISLYLLQLGPLPHQEALPSIGSSYRDDFQLRLAMETAHAAMAGLWLAKIGLVITIFTTVGLVITLALTFSATAQTREIFRIQNRTARAELRPYVSVEAHMEDVVIGRRPRVIVEISNNGATPAYDACVSMALNYQSGWNDEQLDYSEGPPFPPITLNPRTMRRASSRTSTVVRRQTLRELAAAGTPDWMVFTVVGRIDYVDTFGDAHFTTFAQYFFGARATDKGNLPEHNETT